MRSAIKSLREYMHSKFDEDGQQGNLYYWQQHWLEPRLQELSQLKILSLDEAQDFLDGLARSEGLAPIQMKVTEEDFGGDFAYHVYENQYKAHATQNGRMANHVCLHEFTHYWLASTVFDNETVENCATPIRPHGPVFLRSMLMLLSQHIRGLMFDELCYASSCSPYHLWSCQNHVDIRLEVQAFTSVDFDVDDAARREAIDRLAQLDEIPYHYAQHHRPTSYWFEGRSANPLDAKSAPEDQTGAPDTCDRQL